jgi:hypothetical protein
VSVLVSEDSFIDFLIHIGSAFLAEAQEPSFRGDGALAVSKKVDQVFCFQLVVVVT